MPRIVLIDDEPVLRITFSHVLRKQGYEVWVAEDGLKGVYLCRQVHPHLVITDILMPGQGGFTTIETIRKEFPATQVIAMTATEGSSCRELCRQLGAICCVAKPVECALLLRFVTNLLEGAALDEADNSAKYDSPHKV